MIALDTNILIYAAGKDEPQGRDLAARVLLDRLRPGGAILPLQTIGEFLNVCRRKFILPVEGATERVRLWLLLFDAPATQPHDLVKAARLAHEQTLQYFDALIITVAARAGATLLLSEDMHDGLEVEGLRVVNPFVAGNEVWIDGLIDQAR